MKNLLSLKSSQLLTHPHNMRRFYPADQVGEMAESIAANKGVLQPLIVTRDAKDKFIVVDGNMRLAGARLLGDKCPLLECKVVDTEAADQLLTMVIANQIRYDVDPVSEGLHYKALQTEGLTVRDISKRTGIYESRIISRKVLAELDKPIQQLIIENKLPHSADVAKALLSLTSAVRIKLAERLAQNPNVKIKTILNACERMAKDQPPTKKLKRPAVELSGALNVKGETVTAKDVHAAANKVCFSCNQYEGALAQGPAPAWSMIVHSADKTCDTCSLKDMQKICGSCPAVELLRNIIANKGVSVAGNH